MRKLLSILVVIALLALAAWQQHQNNDAASGTDGSRETAASSGVTLPGFLPREAHGVVERILTGRSHPYRQDGSTFQNRERRLPQRPNGYYREYTVPTPGARDRGARRIVTGGDPPVQFWYTADHYRSFRAFEVSP